MDTSEFTAGLGPIGKQISDGELKKRLEQAAQKPVLYSDVLKYLSRQISIRRDRLLNSMENHEPEPEGSDVIWMYLASDAGHVTLKLYQEVKDTQEIKVKQYRAQQVVLALRLQVLAQLYAIRATINENAIATEAIDNDYKQPQDVIKDFRTVLRGYDAQVCVWGLYEKLTPAGWKEAGDALTYNAWSRDFGKGSDAEINWSLFADVVGFELRYQSRKMQELWRWKEVRHACPSITTPLLFLKALALWIFRVTTGFGLKPARFACTVFATVVSFSILYFLDDALARCSSVTWSLAGRAIYYAIGNFTSVGTNSVPCGPFTDVLISIETLIGYFLLSVLAAMLVGRLIDH